MRSYKPDNMPLLANSNDRQEDRAGENAPAVPEKLHPYPRGIAHTACNRAVDAARQFLDLAAADHVLFDAVRKLQAMGFPEHTLSIAAERTRIVGKLAKLQSAAYGEFEIISAAASPKAQARQTLG